MTLSFVAIQHIVMVEYIDICTFDSGMRSSVLVSSIAENRCFRGWRKKPVLYLLMAGVVRVPGHTMQIAAYVHVSTDDQNEDRQTRAIREKYDEQSNEIE